MTLLHGWLDWLEISINGQGYRAVRKQVDLCLVNVMHEQDWHVAETAPQLLVGVRFQCWQSQWSQLACAAAAINPASIAMHLSQFGAGE